MWNCMVTWLGKMTWRAAGIMFIFVVVSLLMTFYVFSNMHMKHQPWYSFPSPCHLDSTTESDMVYLVHKIDEVFRELHVPYVLCYGTLWGALRQGAILPWDNNIDVCTLHSEFTKVSFSMVQETFQQHGVTFKGHFGGGEYHLTFNSASGTLHLWTVSADGEFAYPSGWFSSLQRMLGNTQPFVPAHLLEAPLQSILFHGKNMLVPHENIEMLKYLYPDNWWLEVKPPGC